MESVNAGDIGFLFFSENPKQLYASDSFYGLVLHGVQVQAKVLGLTVEVDIADRYEVPTSLPAMIEQRSVKGLLLVGSAPSQILTFFSSAAPNIVYVDRLDPSGERDAILSDGIGGALTVMRHLGDLGHRKIAFVCPASEAETFNERYQGFQLYCNDKDIPLDPRMVVIEEGYNNLRSRVEALVTSPYAPTAIFAANDLTAAMVLHACHARSISVPGQVSVVGFDDMDLAKHVWPPLTTLHVDIEGIGQQAALRLYERMTFLSPSASRLAPATIRVHGSLVVRESTAPPSSVA